MNTFPAYLAALDKLRPRWPDFHAAGWTSADLTACALTRHGHHGLAVILRPNRDLGRVWEWCCELLGSVSGNGQRSRLYYWRTAPLCQLLATVGRHVIPVELAAEWKEAKIQ